MQSTQPASIPIVLRGRRRYRRYFATVFVSLLLVSFLGGATAIADAAADGFEIAKLVAVIAFIGSMLALAVGMVGDAYRA